jgi:hypothetical protein
MIAGTILFLIATGYVVFLIVWIKDMGKDE